MPTPMPIMAAISGEKFGTVRTWVSSSSRAIPMPRPASAVMTGRPMATTDPKASSIMRMAAVMPMPSLGPGAAVAAALIGAPPSSTWKPWCAAACAVLYDLLDGRDGDVGRVGGELDLREGDVTLARPGDLMRAGRRERAGHALDPGQRLDAGDHLVDRRLVGGARDGRGRVEDDVRGVARLRRERRLQDVRCLLRGGVPAVNLFSKWVPTIWATTVTPMMARIHMTSTVRRRS